ncbi:hypothetical protein M0802_003565 [Mischocyttarus mexicanus]|nr:hypothetical protein M0802_003565 [Mischocyttarus mexicanus]
MAQVYVLYEHAAGYAVFSIKEFEEVGMLLPQVEASITDLSRFKSVVKLIGFLPFKTALAALENINNISEGIVPEDLQLFLDSTLPKSDQENKIILGVSDPKLGASITEVLGIKCDHTGAIPEIIRGIRFHFHNLIKGFTSTSSAVAQLGLGHSYSRAKIKFNVNRVDNMIIQSISLMDQLDKDINTFSMRIREWYGYYFPELDKIVPENYMYAKVTQLIKNRKELTDDNLEALEQIVMDSAKAQAIIDASKSSMGMDINPVDLLNIELFAKRVIGLADYRKKLSEYLKSKMTGIAPNLDTLIGTQVGARLIAHAGSLINLAKYPASTVQILGAEKALFRALKTKGNTPKYGLLFHSTFIGRASTKNKGRISRYLANKCSIASRIDCFSETPTSIFGEKLRQQVEDRLKFYETGEIPKKNIDVMQEAFEEVQNVIADTEVKSKKKKTKNQKRKSEELENGNTTTNGIHENGEKKELVEESEEPVKKKKKKNKKSKSLGDTDI